MGTALRTCAILAIGDELILGQKTDTNSAWIADRMTRRSVRMLEHVTVDDDERTISDAMRRLSRDADVLVCTGGLGPTSDDLTRQSLALAMGDSLVEDPGAIEEIRAWFTGRGREMPEANRVQAMRPARARSLSNPNGTAPGLAALLESHGSVCEVFCLPGPPREMRPMFEAVVEESLVESPDQTLRTRTLHTFGLGESEVARRLGELMDRGREPLVGTTASRGVVTCRVRSQRTSPLEAAVRVLDETERLIRDRLGHTVFSDDESGSPLERAVLDQLLARRECVVVAESCTGGLLGETLTSLPGSSDVFVGGWLTYSNDMKSSLLGVSPQTLAEFGAVSRPVALAMARGALLAAEPAGGADHALAITGIAGPGGGSEDKPVGSVWIARASGDGTDDARLFRFGGGRQAVRQWSAITAIGLLRLHLAGVTTPLLGQVDPPQED